MAVDSEKRESLGFFNFGRVERVLENVFVDFNAVENHLVENQIAGWFQVGTGYSQGPCGREGGMEKDLKSFNLKK